MTIKDVARAAGVSVATVSRVWNEAAFVSPETRRRVAEVAARLGYSPHGAARSLITRTTYALGVLLPDLYGEFFSEIIRGIDHMAQANGYHILVSSSHDSKDEIDAALRSMRGRVDGMIIMSPDLETRRTLHALQGNFPVVLLNGGAEAKEFDTITIENHEGARQMTLHLIARGHRRIAMIGGPQRNYDATERLRGYRTALAESGIELDESLIVQGDFSELSGHGAVKQLLGLERRPTAIFAANDSMAIGALSALRENHVRVPDDMAVAGFDDIPLARYMNPPLSTVHVDISQLGERAAALLLSSLQNDNRSHEQLQLSTTLVIRASCGGVVS
ncbi:MAG: LacI family DNA-binding transcriptional regulator [Gemmatimonas sp.]|nr:LacI family DNA-binding transcriptional regulator [Gemmatimonadaceae bacterium]